ncbi:MAG: tetratricopeptide repeat protein [Planctomycetota bacterium]
MRQWLITLILMVSLPTFVLASDESQWIQSAIDEYTTALDTTDRHERESKFSRAETLFNQAIESGNISSADLYTNLGNAAFQAKRLGPAIAAYRQALKISPSHRRARTNLLHARQRLPEANRYVDPGGLFDSLFFWNGLYPSSTIANWAALAFLFAAILIAASIFTGRTLYRNFALLPLIGWIVLLASWFAGQGSSGQPEAVIVASEVVARTADSVSSTPRFSSPLPGGTEARVIERREKWTQIQVANDRTAWVPSSSLCFLNE